MQDRVPLYPGRVTLTPVSGQANTFDLVRADQPTQEGTPLNKASLLKDTTAALFGKTNAAVPDDILNLLSKSVIAQGTKITDVLGNLISIPADQIKDGVKIATGSYTGTGTYGASNPNSLTFEFAPKLVFVYPQSLDGAGKISTQTQWVIFTQFTILRSSSSSSSIGERCNAPLAWGNALTWWTSDNSAGAYCQGNVLNWVYQYIAIG